MKQLQHSCEQEIRKANLKVTPARVAAMKLFKSLSAPADAQYLINNLHEKLGVDRVTVFRIINAFVQKGLLRKLEFGEGKARYELVTSEHHHLICQRCGVIEDISDCNIAALENDIWKKKKFLVKHHTLEFFGLCHSCQE